MVALPFCGTVLKSVKPKSAKYPKALVTLGDKLRARRLDLGIEQRKVAAVLGCTPSSVVNWEVNRTEIDIRFYPALIDFLGYNPLPEAQTPGQRIAHARASQGLSAKALAKATGVDEMTVRRLEADTPRTAKRPAAIVKSYLGVQ